MNTVKWRVEIAEVEVAAGIAEGPSEARAKLEACRHIIDTLGLALRLLPGPLPAKYEPVQRAD